MASSSFRAAIDAQISTKNTGGTETALLSLLQAFKEEMPKEPLTVFSLQGHEKDLTPFLGPNMRPIVWPGTYTWYTSEADRLKRMTPRWQRLVQKLGSLGPMAMAAHGCYAFRQPLSPRAKALAAQPGMANIIPPLYRFYYGLRYGARYPNRRMADRLLRDMGMSVVHFPYPLHFQTSLPFVYEPWGLPHRHQPELFGAAEAAWMDRLFRTGCHRAAMVITATRWVKRDIVNAYGIAPEKIAVIPRVPRLLQSSDAAVDLPPDLPARFALYPSAVWPTKNHVRLLEAIALLRDREGLRVNLVCTGRTNKIPHWQTIAKILDECKLHDQVRFLGAVSEAQLVALYRSAVYEVHPSTFEGLGLPLIEAFQYDLPVLSSTAACKPEVVGDAAILFDPLRVEDIARAIRAVETNPALLEDLRTRGRLRIVQDFPDPAKMAKMFLTVYRKAAGAPLDGDQRSLLDQMLAE